MNYETNLTTINTIIAEHVQPPVQWLKPDQFDLASWADRQEVSRRFADGRLTSSFDHVDAIADDLFEMRHPEQKDNERARKEYVNEIANQGAAFGQWFNFSWKQTLEHYPNKKDYQDMRTFRNKNLVTDEEQTKLLDATIAVFGLSVGSNVVEQLTLGGIGGTLALGDFDTLSPSNLNRIKSSMAQVGMRKLDIAACKTSEMDPYVKQIHFNDGATDESLARLVEVNPDIIFDEIDDLAIKVSLRRFAYKNHIPLVMATDLGDKSIIDIERYDLHNAKPFNGQLNDSEFERLLENKLTATERQKIMMKIVGLRHITPRLLDSAMETGKTLGGLPQLGTTASAGGALAAVAAREILVGRKLCSGRYVFSPKQTLRLQHQTSLHKSANTLLRFAKSHRT